MGEKNEAFAALDKAIEERSDCVAFLGVDPCLDPLRSDDRFQRLLGSLRL